MLNLPAIGIANGLGIALMLTLVFNTRMNMRKNLVDDRLFWLMCYMTIALCVVETVSFLLDGVEVYGMRVLLLLLNSVLFILNGMFGLIWVMYVHYKLFEDLNRLKKQLVWLSVPAVLNCLLCILNVFFGIIFVITRENIYQRTPFVWLAYLAPYSYLLYSVVLVLMNQRRVGKYLFLPVLVFLVPVFAGSMLQMLFYGIALIWVFVAFGLTALYINLQNEISLLDSLTKLYNREYFHRYMNYLKQKPVSGKMVSGILIDVDSFKMINDTYGHSEGDVALREVAKILLSVITGNDFAARYGGDEFIVISAVTREQEIMELMQEIRRRTEEWNSRQNRPYQLAFSMGASIYRPGTDTVDSFLRRMDEQMYLEKKKRYSSAEHDRRRRA